MFRFFPKIYRKISDDDQLDGITNISNHSTNHLFFIEHSVTVLYLNWKFHMTFSENLFLVKIGVLLFLFNSTSSKWCPNT